MGHSTFRCLGFRQIPDVLAQEIVEDLEAALEQFREIAADLSGETTGTKKQD